MSLPPEFVARLGAIVPEDRLDGVLASFGAPKRLVAWENPLRVASPGEAQAALTRAGATLTPLELTPEGVSPCGQAFVIEGLPREALTRDPGLSPLLERGLLYLINPSSLLPPAALAPEPGEQVLDLCAAPGGKSIQLAARLFSGAPTPDTGHLAAVEAIKPRFFKLKALLERYGAPAEQARVRLFLKDGRAVGGAVPERFDRVLIDAPCSSEARFESEDDASMAHWSPRKLAECAHKQKGLLRSGLDALRVGGRLVYCTCSFAPEENEAVVSAVLAELDGTVTTAPTRFPDAVPTQPGLELPDAVRVLPDTTWDGFFLVRLVKHARMQTRFTPQPARAAPQAAPKRSGMKPRRSRV